jgi:hypothetical protein
VVILFRLDLLLLLRRLVRLLRRLWRRRVVPLLSLGHAALESRRTLQIFGSALDQSLPRARNGILREAQATLSFRAQAFNFFHSVMRPAPGKIAASWKTRRREKSSGACDAHRPARPIFNSLKWYRRGRCRACGPSRPYCSRGHWAPAPTSDARSVRAAGVFGAGGRARAITRFSGPAGGFMSWPELFEPCAGKPLPMTPEGGPMLSGQRAGGGNGIWACAGALRGRSAGRGRGTFGPDG